MKNIDISYLINVIYKNLINVIYRNKLIIYVTLIYFIISSIWVLSLHYSFQTTGYDLGQYTNMFWKTVNGEGILTTDLRSRPGNLYGFYLWEHFSPVLFLIVPIFYIFPRPETLLILKIFFMSMSIPVLWMIVRNNLGNTFSSIIVISYVLNPFLFQAMSFDFQEQFMLPFIIFLEFYFYLNKRYGLFIFFTIFGLLINEYSAALAVFTLFGLSIMEYRSLSRRYNIDIIKKIKDRIVLIPICMMLVSLIYFFVVIFIMESHAVTGVIVDESGRRANTIEYVLSFVSDPSNFSDNVLDNIRNKILYFNLFLMPTFYLSLLSTVSIFPIILYTGFGWMINYPSFYEFGAHHSLYLIPYIYIGSILSIKNLDLRLDYISEKSKKLIFFLAIMTYILIFMNQASYYINREFRPVFDEHNKILHDIIESIPNNASILTQNNIYPHVATRSKSYVMVDYTRYNQLLEAKGMVNFEYIIIDERSKWSQHPKLIIESLEKTKHDDYGIFIHYDGIYVVKKDYTGPINEIKGNNFRAVYTKDDISLSEGYKKEDMLIHPYGYMSNTFWFGPYKMIPPGEYNVILDMKRDEKRNYRNDINNDGHLITLDIMKNKDDILVSKDINYSNVNIEWTNVSLTFKTDSIITNLEIRGVKPSPDDNIYLRNIVVEGMKESMKESMKNIT